MEIPSLQGLTIEAGLMTMEKPSKLGERHRSMKIGVPRDYFLALLDDRPPNIFTVNWIADYASPHALYGLLLDSGAASNWGAMLPSLSSN